MNNTNEEEVTPPTLIWDEGWPLNGMVTCTRCNFSWDGFAQHICMFDDYEMNDYEIDDDASASVDDNATPPSPHVWNGSSTCTICKMSF